MPELRPVEREVGIAAAPVVEQELAEARALDPLQELLRHDLVGVDVGAVERGDRARDADERLHQLQLLTSTRCPAIAAAAAIAGRHEVGARRRRPAGPRSCGWRSRRSARPGARMSGFMPRHMRAAGVAPLEAGGAEDAVEPLRLGLPLHLHRSRARPWRARRARRACPRTTRAAARRSSMRLLVHEPMNTRSIVDALERRAGLEAHVGQAARAPSSGGRRLGHAAGDRRRLAGVGAPGDLRRDVRARRRRSRGRTPRPSSRAAARASARAAASASRPAARAGGPRR